MSSLESIFRDYDAGAIFRETLKKFSPDDIIQKSTTI